MQLSVLLRCLVVLTSILLSVSSHAQVVRYGQAMYGAVVYSQTVPGIPSITNVSVSHGSATITFNPPVDTGGGVISSYTVIASSSTGSTSSTCTDSPCLVTDLTNGTTYTFTIAANSAVGTGPTSAASNPATPPITVTPSAASIPVMPYYLMLMMACLVGLFGQRRLRS